MVCLDTTFIIDVLRGNEEVRKKKEEFDQIGELNYTPTPVIVELVGGAHLKGKKEKEIEEIKRFLSTTFILPLDYECAIKAGEIVSELMQKDILIGPEDAMIAAIAIQNNEALVTRNLKHFEKIPGLKVEGY